MCCIVFLSLPHLVLSYVPSYLTNLKGDVWMMFGAVSLVCSITILIVLNAAYNANCFRIFRAL